MADTDKTYEILNYYGLKTNIEDTKKWIKQYVADALTGITTDLMTNVTYNELVSLKDSNNLKPGMLYRMTDYVTKVYSEDGSVSSAEHPFDLILFTNSNNTLNENVFACLNRNSDGYFDECNINVWEIKYGLDNNTNCFEFADTENGKGVIYYMKDEYNNEAPFDFKNILQNDGEYTFGNNGEDYSLNGYANGIYNNKILPCVDSETGKQTINRIRVTGNNCNTNIFKPTCVNSYINFQISECDISMNDDGELVIFKTQDFVSGIENKPIEHNYKNDYLTFEAVNDDTEIIFKTYTDDSTCTRTIEVSKDKKNWETKTSSSEGVILASLNAGEKLYLRGNNSCYAYFDENEGEYLPNFILPLNDCYVYGNVMSLIDSNNFRTLTEITDDYALYSLFYDYWNGDYSGEYVLSHQDKKLVLPATTLANYCYNYMFYDCTNLTTAPELPATALVEWCYSSMFSRCSSLTTVPSILPATELADGCYEYMFGGCSSLATAPELPATALTQECYYGMFQNCTSLTTAPELPATTLASYCYQDMFYNCTSLTTAPILPATELADGCYEGMFVGCSSLATAPELPATELADGCYEYMFGGCSSLATAPELPATELAEGCYSHMFFGCSGLTTVPQNLLPATTLADSCYSHMFSRCGSLTTAPELPATTLVEFCYQGMFSRCSSLTTAPELPATTLVEFCYQDMFSYCTSLTTAPELSATTLAVSCYERMFWNCSSLNYIKCLAVNGINTNGSTSNWVYHVQTNSGTFIKHPFASWNTCFNSGIPCNWTVEDAVIE